MKTTLKIILLLAIFSGIELSQAAEVSFYRDIGTVHASKYNDELNNDNDVTIVKIDGFLAGSMVNSYGNDGYFFGYQPTVYSYGKVDVDFGVTAVTGYEKCEQVKGMARDGRNVRMVITEECDDYLMIAPILSLSYNFNDHIAIQANNMGVVFNAGLRINF